MKNEILQLLKNSEDYISGQQICDRFQVSRTAVWKVVEQLKREGYEIEAVRNRGYRLCGCPDVISEAEINSMLKTAWAGRRIVYYGETDSTNNRAKEAGAKGAVHGTLFVADAQNAGKGRRGRGWVSPAGTSIYMTLLLRPEISPAKAPMLTLVAGLSVAEGIREITGCGRIKQSQQCRKSGVAEGIRETAGVDAGIKWPNDICRKFGVAEGIRGTAGVDVAIKWPNDIVIGKKKVCGILTEMAAEMECVDYVAIGIGINVNQQHFPEEIARMATSIYAQTGVSYRRSELIAAVLERFEKNYGTFMETRDLSGVMEDYNALLINCKQEIRVLEPGNEYEAFAEGINREGELVAVLPDGQRKNIFAGEVSVRGVYGYV